MPIFSDALKAQLNLAATKLDWASKVQTLLGNDRRVRCFYDSNASATDPSATGIEFLSIGSSGDLAIMAGNIVGFGTLSGTTKRMAADLSTGKAILRLEGNGHTVTYTLGLTGSGCEFVLRKSPTGSANEGFAFAPGSGMKAPVMMDSGTGPLSPKPDADTPAYLIVEDWSSGSAVEAGRIQYNTRIPNMVFDHPEHAAEMGDVRVIQSDQIVNLGTFEFGSTLFCITPTINSVENKPWYQVIVAWKPNETDWPGYPRFSGYREGQRTLTYNGVSATASYGISNTFAPPFKCRLCRADGSTIYVFDMPRDHLPINSDQLSDVATKTKAIRPHTHCASWLVWQSVKPKLSKKAKKYVPGVHARSLLPNIGKQGAHFNGIYPLRYNQQGNGDGHWYAGPKWAQPCNSTVLYGDAARTNDPYLFDITAYECDWGSGSAWMNVTEWHGVQPDDSNRLSNGRMLQQGWGYEPGAWGYQDMHTWCGGSRVDRAPVPTPILIHMTDPTWVHQRDKTSIDDMIWDWNLTYFNQPWHHVTDARTLSSIPVNEVLRGDWADSQSHYSYLRSYTAGGEAFAISQLQRQQNSTLSVLPHGGEWVDANYRMPYNGAAIDNLHSHSNPGLVARLYNSPAHAASMKFRYLRSIMCQMGQNATTPTGNFKGWFMLRTMAWKWTAHNDMWALSGDHPLLISRADMEARIVAELTGIYNNGYLPIWENNDQSIYSQCFRTFGVPLDETQSPTYVAHFALHFYLAMTLQQWKQSGLFDRMWNYSSVTQKALLCVIKILDVSGIQFFTEINGIHVGLGGGEYGGGPNLFVSGSSPLKLLSGWTDYVTQSLKTPPDQYGQADFVHDKNGNLVIPDTSEWLKAQWPFIRKYYFSNIPCAYDVDLAISRVKGYYAAWDARIASMEASGTAKSEIGRLSWNLFPHLGEPLPPAELGTY